MTSQFAVRASKQRTASSSKPLRRGQACINCRSLKIKCDGTKPICGPCTRNPRQDPCEYTDDIANSKARALEETVAHLQARIRDLESQSQAGSSPITLTSPYGPSEDIALSPPLLLGPARFDTWSEHSPISAPNTPFGYPPQDLKTVSTGSPASSSSSSNASLFDDPPYPIMESLISAFIIVSDDFGFFLDISRFRAAALLAFPSGHFDRPAPALLSAVYLLGAHASPQDALARNESIFLHRTLQQVATDLAGSHPHRITHTMQAEVLLAYYFFRSGRYIEAKCHTSAAVSISLSCGLHRLRSMQPPSPGGLTSNWNSILPPAMDMVEEGERINAFWTVFILHKCIAVALDPPSSLCGAFEAPGIRIDTPWPLDMATYKEGQLPPNFRGAATVRNFLNDIPVTDPAEGQSNLAIYAKAAIMFHRASHLSGQWTPALGSRESHAFSIAFRSLDDLLEKFKMSLALVGNPSSPIYVLAQALAHTATLKLHKHFAQTDSQSASRCLAAAKAIIENTPRIEVSDRPCVNPIYGTVWMEACLVLSMELTRLRTLRRTWSDMLDQDGGNEQEVSVLLHQGLSAMHTFASDSPLMTIQLNKVNDSIM